MGGFFGLVSKRNAVPDVFFGTDYHSHLGTARAGMATWNPETGFIREIHNIENSPFRTKFCDVIDEMKGPSCIGVISDTDPQPLLVRSNLGTYAIATVGRINNFEDLVQQYVSFSGGHLGVHSGGIVCATELVAAMIDQKSSFKEGIRFAQKVIKGTMSILILKEDGNIIASRDKVGRIPVSIGKDKDGFCVAFEPFTYQKLGYSKVRELGAGEIVELSATEETVLSAPLKKKHICAFLWSYYGYPNADYEGVNVEIMRNRNGEIMAKNDIDNGKTGFDSVSGVPDSGTPHAIGYANFSKVPFTRPFVKYTQTWLRSFMPGNMGARLKVAKMKQIPVPDLIRGRKLLLVDDSIVRGTQLGETINLLYENGAKEVHMRSACPPIMYGCKYLNFSTNSSDMDLLARRIICELEGEDGFNYISEYADGTTERGKKLREAISKKYKFASLEYQTLDGIIKAIGLPECDICTYCWSGKED